MPADRPVNVGLVLYPPPFTEYEYVGVPPVTEPKVMLPNPDPQIILFAVNPKLVIGGEFVIGTVTVKGHPNVLVIPTV